MSVLAAPSDPLRVLVVDDNSSFAALLSALLEEAGTPVDVEVAGSLAEGLTALAERHRDCVLLDLGLPDASSDDTIRRIVAAAAATPVIVVSGHPDPDLPARARRAGALEFLGKHEVDVPRLAALLAHAATKARRAAPAAPPDGDRRSGVFAAPLAGAAVAAALGGLGIAGWATGSRGLLAWGSSQPTIKLTAALSLVAVSVALALLQAPTPARRRAAIAAAAAVTAVGLAVIAEWCLGVSLGIDELLVHDPATSGVPGRPSPHTAVALVLVGGALLTLEARSPRAQRLYGWFATAFGATVVLAATGWLYGADALTGSSHVTGMALPTLLALLALLLGLGSRPDRPPALWLRGTSPTATLMRRLAPAAVLAPPLFGLLRLLGETAGLYDERFGLAVFATSMVVAFFALVVRTAATVQRRDSDRASAERTVGRSEQRFRTLSTAAPVGMLEADAAGACTDVNPRWCEMTGLSPADCWGEGWTAALHPEDRERVLAQWRAAVAGGLELALSHRVRRPDGTVAWLAGRATAVRDAAGVVTGYLATVTDVTRLKEAERAARESEARLHAIIDHLPASVYVRDLEGRFELVNAQVTEALGRPVHEILGRGMEELLGADIGERAHAEEQPIRDHGEVVSYETSFPHADGTRHDSLVIKYPLPDADGRVTSIGGVAVDITARKHAEEQVREAEERFRNAFESAPIGMAITDRDGRFVRVNEAFCATTGYAEEQLLTMTFKAITHPDDLAAEEALLAELVRGDADRYHCEKRYMRGLGDLVWVAVDKTVLERGADGEPSLFLGQVQDITERRQFEQRLQHLADHDPLTGLLNRRRFEQELDRHLAHVHRYGPAGALLVLDLDHFKTVNDTLGHSAGDELIVTVAGLLGARLRDSDAIARLGGDEFAVLLPEGDEAAATRVAASIVDEIREHAVVRCGERPRRVTASLGLACFEPGLVSSQDALVNADLAMYDAKEAGRDRYAVYAPERYGQPRMRARMTWVERIRSAMEDERFVLHAQPILDLRTNRVRQYELLLRMVDEVGDVVPPAAFLFIAERYDLIQEIDRWVAARAIRIIEEHNARGEELVLEVNLSGKSLGDERLLAGVEHELRRSGIDPHCLIFEITETAAVANIAIARQFAERLNALGCRFALDDFGAGFGSFYYLKHIPFDYLKIDGEFVTGCTTSRTDQLVIQALVGIAGGLGKETIAEFVENEATQRFLLRNGVDHAQGHHIGKPAPLEVALSAHF